MRSPLKPSTRPPLTAFGEPGGAGAVSRDSPLALYSQIAGRLREEIRAGRFGAEGRLPSEAELVDRYDVSRVTARLAFDELVADGLVVRRQGKGTYVAPTVVRHGLDTLRSFHESLRLQGLDAGMSLLERRLVRTPAEWAERFGHASHVLRLKRLHTVEGRPVGLGVSHLPRVLHRVSAQETAAQPAYALIEACLGARPVRADIAITACAANASDARRLEVDEGAPLLVMARTSYLPDGRCCDESRFLVRPERYEFLTSSVFRSGDGH